MAGAVGGTERLSDWIGVLIAGETIPFCLHSILAVGGTGSLSCHAAAGALSFTVARTTGAASAGPWPTNRSTKRHQRALSKAQKFRQRLGGSLCTDDPFPEKPKGMHWRTYGRLAERGEALDEQAERAGLAMFGALMADWQ